jgi:hypothetical protein
LTDRLVIGNCDDLSSLMYFCLGGSLAVPRGQKSFIACRAPSALTFATT